jgi:ribosomal-protein-alanine N-acetyltransferase
VLSSPVVVRQHRATDAKIVEEIERMSIKELTPLTHLSRSYEIIDDCFLVAEVEGKVVSYVVANMHFARDGVWEGHILGIAVHPAYRRNGIGRHLLAEVSRVLEARGASRMRLEVKVGNSDAKQFYVREGFKEAAVVRGYYRMRGYSEDAVVMVKELNT